MSTVLVIMPSRVQGTPGKEESVGLIGIYNAPPSVCQTW